MRGVLDAFAISVSHGLQFGVPLKDYVKSFTSMSFAPAGITDDPEIRTASSIIDFIARRLALTYLSFDDRLELGLASIDDMPDSQVQLPIDKALDKRRDAKTENDFAGKAYLAAREEAEQEPKVIAKQVAEKVTVKAERPSRDDTAPLCFNCGNQTQKAGSCYVCTACGSTTGCS